MCKLGLSFFLLVCAVSFVRFEAANALTEETLANRINAFGCNLLHGLYKDTAPEENILFSPFSTYVTLALLHLGSADKTRDDLSTVMKLHDTKNYTEFHDLMKIMVEKLSSSADGPTFSNMKQANGIFLRNDLKIRESYGNVMIGNYNAVAKNVDFSDHPLEAMDAINNWVSSATDGRIANFYEQPLSPDTVAVLISALSFNGKWKNKFLPANTVEETFHTGVTEIHTPIMRRNATLFYYSDEDLHYETVSLPYTGGQYEMNIYLQHKGHDNYGTLADLFHELAQKNFDSRNSTLRFIDLKLPKMKFSWKKSVVDALKLKNIFNAPNLTNMTPMRNVKISNMIHATELEVDEEGTIASAATAIEMILFSAHTPSAPETVHFHVDRPCLVTIRHIPTGTLLFASIVRKPMM